MESNTNCILKSAKEYNDIKSKFDEVLAYSQEHILNGEVPHTTKLFDTWGENKYRIYYEILGRKLILEDTEDITIHVDDARLKYEYNDFLSDLKFRGTYEENGQDMALYHMLVENISAHEFMYNECSHKFNFTYFSKENEEKTCEVQVGAKVLKLFKYFYSDKDQLCYMQDKASRKIQGCKITGRLCISIHPLDYLSTSNNAHNWRSCHALDGEFRCGGLAYMCDRSTFIAYLKATDHQDDYQLEGWPEGVRWNSKKWRMLIHCSTSNPSATLAAGRQYPMDIPEAADRVLGMIEDQLRARYQENGWSPKTLADYTTYTGWTNETTKNTIIPYYNMGKYIECMDAMVMRPSKQYCYNDLLYSHTYTVPKIAYIQEQMSGRPKFSVGVKHLPCIVCGEKDIDNPDEMCCSDCQEKADYSGYYYCDCCGRALHESRDYIYWGAGDEPICENCYDEYYVTCEDCGAVIREEDAEWYSDMPYCEDCYERLIDDLKDD